MIPEANRLTKQRDFKKIAQSGKKAYCPNFTLKFIRTNLENSRLAIVVSLKVAKKAVVRNKIKRQLREIIKTALPVIKRGYDILLIVKPQAKNLSYAELKENFNFLFKKAGLC